MRVAVGLPAVRARSTARDSHRPALLDIVGAISIGARDERAQRACSAHAVIAQELSRRGLCLLFGPVFADAQARKGRIEEFSDQPAMDDFALKTRMRA
jgi:hypothetical protein